MALKLDSPAVPTKYNTTLPEDISVPWTESLLAGALSRLEFSKGDTILDFGCGIGNLTSKYLVPAAEKLGCKVFAVDISASKIDFAQQHHRHANVYYVAGDITSNKFPLVGVRFNKIICNMVLEHVPDYGKMIADLVKLLKPNGTLWVMTTADRRMFRCVNNIKAQTKFSGYLDDEEVVMPDWVRENGRAAVNYKKALEKENLKAQELVIHDQALTFKEYRDIISSLICSNPTLPEIPTNLLDEFNDQILCEFGVSSENAATCPCVLQMLTFIVRN